MRTAYFEIHDAAHASDARAARLFETAGAMRGFSVDHDGVARGPRAAILARFHRRDLKPCRHLSPRRPEELFWVPYRPGRVRCMECLARVEREIRGSYD